MNFRRVRNVAVIAVLAALPASLPLSVKASAGEPAVASDCAAPEYRQYDFWIGDWDTFDVGSKTPNARVRVSPILNGCVVHEEYSGTDGHQGESFSVYDKSRGVWHQTWVTNRGELLVIEGKFQGGAMVLSGSDLSPEGKPRLVRGTWRAEGGGIRETAARSLDGGRTWEPWFDLMFRAHR